jgi:hypothetical protein
LTDYSPTARRHVSELVSYFRMKHRPEAIRNMLAALVRVEAAIETGAGRPRDFPATYRNLARPGRAWRKESIYWIAYDQTDPPVIVAVFWEGADIAGRYPDVP